MGCHVPSRSQYWYFTAKIVFYFQPLFVVLFCVVPRNLMICCCKSISVSVRCEQLPTSGWMEDPQGLLQQGHTYTMLCRHIWQIFNVSYIAYASYCSQYFYLAATDDWNLLQNSKMSCIYLFTLQGLFMVFYCLCI